MSDNIRSYNTIDTCNNDTQSETTKVRSEKFYDNLTVVDLKTISPCVQSSAHALDVDTDS